MTYHALRQVPDDEKSQWLEDLFGIEHEDYGLTDSAAEKIKFQTLTTALGRYRPGRESALREKKLGILVENDQLKIAESLRKRLCLILWLPILHQSKTLTAEQRIEIEEAEDFVRAWIKTKVLLNPEEREEGTDPLKQREPPSWLRER